MFSAWGAVEADYSFALLSLFVVALSKCVEGAPTDNQP